MKPLLKFNDFIGNCLMTVFFAERLKKSFACTIFDERNLGVHRYVFVICILPLAQYRCKSMKSMSESVLVMTYAFSTLCK